MGGRGRGSWGKVFRVEESDAREAEDEIAKVVQVGRFKIAAITAHRTLVGSGLGWMGWFLSRVGVGPDNAQSGAEEEKTGGGVETDPEERWVEGSLAVVTEGHLTGPGGSIVGIWLIGGLVVFVSKHTQAGAEGFVARHNDMIKPLDQGYGFVTMIAKHKDAAKINRKENQSSFQKLSEACQIGSEPKRKRVGK